MPKKVCKSFSDLSVEMFSKTLHVKSFRRHYDNAADIVYDFIVGMEFYVTDSNSPFHGCFVSVDDRLDLHTYGYRRLSVDGGPDVNISEIRI